MRTLFRNGHVLTIDGQLSEFEQDDLLIRGSMVGEQIVVEDGKILNVDEEVIKAEAREIMKSYHKEMERTWEAAKKLEPYYREMYSD